ncbi:MAG: hypothetical protein JWO36_6212 [Myxococcales bacterium]|nr:hypothetical protein [Myxococcales bacterium]
MNTGAVVMLDALGFKGIWKRHPEVLEKLKLMPRIAEVTVGGFMKGVPAKSGLTLHPEVSTTFLSDTIVIGARMKGATDDVHDRWAEVALAALFTASIMSIGANVKAPPLAYRGVISFGEFEIDGPFIVGPAIDEAAELMNMAEAAIAWLTPTARVIVNTAMKADPNMALGGMFLPWAVPLKGGGTYDTFVAHPFAAPPLSGTAEEMRDKILSSFNNSRIEIQIKKQNTQRFLDAALKAKPDWKEAIERANASMAMKQGNPHES